MEEHGLRSSAAGYKLHTGRKALMDMSGGGRQEWFPEALDIRLRRHVGTRSGPQNVKT